ncbi:type II/IV secretion system ATPase subunit [Halococcoides cellulosivorans]|uniref:Type II secretion system protein n=1 Tax=Halococcoides cellulosivorans TaxID=1679096 RepID=A0A2R4WZF4_9EURY|nr:type II/IV secretion system ATPase subunit [Halococcoides cellulosivorans]AWB26917.1 type II secretion system protein [Halococcoides cellulosivorans]
MTNSGDPPQETDSDAVPYTDVESAAEAHAELDRDPRTATAPTDSPDADRVQEDVLDAVHAHFEPRADFEDAIGPPDPSFVDAEWFDFGYLDGLEEVERTWVNEPYAYVTVLFDESTNTNRYHVVEPTLDEFEEFVREDLVRALRTELMYTEIDGDLDRETVFDAEAKRIMHEQAETVSNGSLRKILYYLHRDFVGSGKIDPIMRDRDVEDISCDGADRPVFVYHNGFRDLETNLSFGDQRLNAYVMRLAQRAGKQLSVADPLVDAALPDGSRAQLTLGGEVTTHGSNFTVRKFAEVPLTPIDLIEWGTFSLEQMAFLWLAVENHASLFFAGGTGSGKTTSLNAISLFVPPESKVVTIEDTPEITLPHENAIQSVTREPITAGGSGAIGMYELLQTALRQRPEYLVVGEIRTESQVAHTFFQAIATGHTAFTTFHADSIRGLLSRLQNEPLDVPKQMIGNLDLISLQKQVQIDGKRVRRTSRLVEVVSEDVSARDVFRRDAATDTIEQVNESALLANMADELGWPEGRIERELQRREEVLEYLLDDGVTDYDAVARTIQGFIRDPRHVLERVRAGSFDPDDLPEEAE